MIILDMGLANEIRHYDVTSSLTGGVHTQNDPWIAQQNYSTRWTLVRAGQKVNQEHPGHLIVKVTHVPEKRALLVTLMKHSCQSVFVYDPR